MMFEEVNRKIAEVTRQIRTCETDIENDQNEKNKLSDCESELTNAGTQAKSMIDKLYHDLSASLQTVKQPGLKLIENLEAETRAGIFTGNYTAIFDEIESIKQEARQKANQKSDKEKKSRMKKARLEEELRRLQQELAAMGGNNI